MSNRTRRGMVFAAAASLLAGGLTLTTGGSAIAAADPSGVDCAALVDFTSASVARTTMTSAVVIAAAGATPAYCDVTGTITNKADGTSTFKVSMPLDGYNDRLYFRGCGGSCGANYAHDKTWTAKGYVQASTDMVTNSFGSLSFKWARNNREAEIDFSYRATHEATVVTKELIKELYGAKPAHSYFWGGSTGGRQGLVAAQRFPADYDGIINNYPASNETKIGTLHLLWSALSNLDEDGNNILTNADAEVLHASAMAYCDPKDGLVDRLIEDPRACDFKAAMSGLSPAKAAAAQKIYDGPQRSDGTKLTPGGPQIGSELNWRNNYIYGPGSSSGEFPGRSTYIAFGGSFTRDAAYEDDLPLDWDPTTFDFDADHSALDFMEQLYTGTNSDLTKFKERGGKLLQFQGWSDQSVLPGFTVDYYNKTVQMMGGRSATDPFYRLFMVPGLGHSTVPVDTQTYLENWVENGVAPDGVVATGLKAAVGATQGDNRTLYPYPLVSRYAGTGDIDSAASWIAADPNPQATAPGAPRSVKVAGTSRDRTRTISWKAPATDGGSPITGYRVTIKKGSKALVSTTLSGSTLSYSANRSKLATGTHTVEIAATNAKGSTSAFRQFTVKKAAKPGKARSIKISGSSTAGKRTISWKAPATDGGARITSYRVTIKKGTKTLINKTVSGSSLRYAISRSKLATGTLTVQITAKNSVGRATAAKKFTVRK